MVQAALEGVIRLVVCPRLLDECRDVLHRDKFRPHLTLDEADVLVGSVEAASDLVSNPMPVVPISADPDDDYLLALAARERVNGVISGDSDLLTDTGPRVLTPRQVLDLLLIAAPQRLLLVMALWNLHLRLNEVRQLDPRLATLRNSLRSAATKIGGDPDVPLFNAPRLDEKPIDLRQLNQEERSVTAFALQLDRRASGSLHAEHAEQLSELLAAFQITDIYRDAEQLIEPN